MVKRSTLFIHFVDDDLAGVKQPNAVVLFRNLEMGTETCFLLSPKISRKRHWHLFVLFRRYESLAHDKMIS
jgi:hypothetical protein